MSTASLWLRTVKIRLKDDKTNEMAMFDQNYRRTPSPLTDYLESLGQIARPRHTPRGQAVYSEVLLFKKHEIIDLVLELEHHSYREESVYPSWFLEMLPRPALAAIVMEKLNDEPYYTRQHLRDVYSYWRKLVSRKRGWFWPDPEGEYVYSCVSANPESISRTKIT